MTEVPVIECAGLTKRYDGRTVVQDVSFRLDSGKLYGFLGRNGAGKTTTMRMVLGLVAPSSGRALIAGMPYADLRAPATTVGAMLDARAVHPTRTLRQDLTLAARQIGVDPARVNAVADAVGLGASLGVACGKLSMGMQQRLGIGRALLGEPQILILDEPTNGLDPLGMQWLRGALRQFVAGGGTVLFSSHVLAEVQALADELLVIDGGVLVHNGPLLQVANMLTDQVRVVTTEPERLVAMLLGNGVNARQLDSRTVMVEGAAAETVSRHLVAGRFVFTEFGPVTPDLEAAFLDLTRLGSGVAS